MTTVTSADGQRETVTVRRTESADAGDIDSLISSSTQSLFGRVNVINILEKANLALSVADAKGSIVAHASFFDYPAGDVVDQAHWEAFLHQHFQSQRCTPVNTLFLHLFVARAGLASACVKELMRSVFNAVTELDHVCLLSPYAEHVGEALAEVLQPMRRLTDPGPPCSALICLREDFSPRLHFRPARVEDHDDIMHMCEGQTTLTPPTDLLEILETQDETRHAAVCQMDVAVVGFFALAIVDVKQLHGNFDLSGFDGLNNAQRRDQDPPEDHQGQQEETEPPSTSTTLPKEDPQQTGGPPETRICSSHHQEDPQQTGGPPETRICSSHHQEDPQQTGGPPETRICSIQHLLFDKRYEMRSPDCITYISQCFPDMKYCMMTVPSWSPEPVLLQNLVHVPGGPTRTGGELYVLRRTDLRTVKVRPAMVKDRPAIARLVRGLNLGRFLLQDLDSFYQTQSDPDAVLLQAFVAQVHGEVVGVVIIRDEQDLDYVRSHYNLENFIYFSHHGYQEHALLRHFVLPPSVQHISRHLMKEVLRLSHRSCLHLRVYPPLFSQVSCVHPLDAVLRCGVPVRPRRQIVYPLEELGINAPSRRITEQQAPFALGLITRKLTLEPRASINARIVVVGASDTGIAFLKTLCLCPHLWFNNLVLVSTHGFPGNQQHEEVGFLSTSHAFSSRDLVQVPLLPSIQVVTGKMVRINRKSKYVLVSDGGTVPYDHLFLCMGLQYQVPCPVSGQPIRKSLLPPHTTRPRPSNLFTINDLHDAEAARQWLSAGFVELEDDAIVYGSSIDVYTTVQTLLVLGVRGSRIHLILPPPEPGASCFADPAVEKAVTAALRSSGVQVHRGSVLVQMDVDEQSGRLTSVSFSSDTEALVLQVGVFINLSNKGVDSDTLTSISKSGLGFDGRLLISSTFRTADPAIFAAGPLTNYSYRYYTRRSHKDFNSSEVGQEMAAMFLSLLDSVPPSEEDRLVPLYDQPKIEGGMLPGGYHYLHVTLPVDPHLEAPGRPDEGMVTGRVETGNYFRLHLDSNQMVDSLTCLSLQPLPVSNYLCLLGKHEQLLGRLLSRYQQGLVHDLYSFFRQSWCMPIFHDRYSDLQQELRTLRLDQASGRLKENKSGGLVTGEPGSELVPADGREYAEIRAAARKKALEFLNFNQDLLPMFWSPGKL